VGAIYSKAIEDGTYVFPLLLIGVRRVLLGYVRRRVAAGVVSDTSIITTKTTNLPLPRSVVGSELMNPDDGGARTGFLGVEPDTVGVNKRHAFSL